MNPYFRGPPEHGTWDEAESRILGLTDAVRASRDHSSALLERLRGVQNELLAEEYDPWEWEDLLAMVPEKRRERFRGPVWARDFGTLVARANAWAKRRRSRLANSY